MNIAKCLRTPILKNICEWLLQFVITTGDSILTILQLFFQFLLMTLHKQIALQKKRGFPLTEAAVL